MRVTVTDDNGDVYSYDTDHRECLFPAREAIPEIAVALKEATRFLMGNPVIDGGED